MKDAWFKEHLTGGKSSLTFSFTYDGQPSAKLLAEWPAKVANERLDAKRPRRTITWTDPKTGLEVRCVALDYADYPSVEWTVWFKNTGTADTPILKDVRGMDVAFEQQAVGDPTLHYIDGDGSFVPHEQRLGRGTQVSFASRNGRPTDGCFPCYNLDWSDRGLIAAIGWPGQWSSTLSCDTQGVVWVQAGQELTNFKLFPGEDEGPGCDVLKDKLTAASGPSVGGTWVVREVHQRASLDTDSCVLAFDRFVEATEWVKALSLDAIGKNAEKFAESLGPTAEIDADIYWTAPGVGYARGETKLEAYADKNRVVGIKATANADFDSVVKIRDEISAKLKVKPKATDAGGYEWKGRVPVTLEQSGTDFIVVYVGKKLWD